MRVTASYSYKRLVAAAIEPYSADHDGVSAIGSESRLSSSGCISKHINFNPVYTSVKITPILQR